MRNAHARMVSLPIPIQVCAMYFIIVSTVMPSKLHVQPVCTLMNTLAHVFGPILHNVKAAKHNKVNILWYKKIDQNHPLTIEHQFTLLQNLQHYKVTLLFQETAFILFHFLLFSFRLKLPLTLMLMAYNIPFSTTR